MTGLVKIVLLASIQLQATAQQPPPGFDAYVKRVMQTFTVPGLSVAIVKDGKVILAKGYGVRRMGEPGLVDAHTRFGIASNTKLFTATALAILVEDGKVDLQGVLLVAGFEVAMLVPRAVRRTRRTVDLDEAHPRFDQPASEQTALAEAGPAIAVLHLVGFLLQRERLAGLGG